MSCQVMIKRTTIKNWELIRPKDLLKWWHQISRSSKRKKELVVHLLLIICVLKYWKPLRRRAIICPRPSRERQFRPCFKALMSSRWQGQVLVKLEPLSYRPLRNSEPIPKSLELDVSFYRQREKLLYKRLCISDKLQSTRTSPWCSLSVVPTWKINSNDSCWTLMWLLPLLEDWCIAFRKQIFLYKT